MEDDWEKAITAVKQKYNINISLKEEQKEILQHLQKKKYVFGPRDLCIKINQLLSSHTIY
jgi:hypothetical protein